MGNVDKSSMKLTLTVLTNLMPDVYAWTCTIWMTLFAVSHKWSGNSKQVFINQRNFRRQSIGKHNFMGHLLPCAIDFKTNHPPTHLQWIGKFGIATEPRHVISMGPRQRKCSVRPLSAATSSVWRTLLSRLTIHKNGNRSCLIQKYVKNIHGWGNTQQRESILDELRNRFCTIFATDF